MKPPVLLMFAMRGERAAKVRMIAMRLRVRVRPVAPSEYGLPIAQLLDAPGASDAGGEALPEEMLLMARFPDGLAQAFLGALRTSLRPGVTLKAVFTPTNAAWDARALFAELKREREALSAGKSAHAKKSDS